MAERVADAFDEIAKRRDEIALTERRPQCAYLTGLDLPCPVCKIADSERHGPCPEHVQEWLSAKRAAEDAAQPVTPPLSSYDLGASPPLPWFPPGARR